MGLESKDPFLADYKESMREVVKGLKTVGPSGLRLLMVEMIRSRWIRDRRTTYPFEVAWVFDREENAVARVLKGLEESGDIEPVGLRGGNKTLARPYGPRTLRKVALSTRPSSAKSRRKNQLPE